MIHSVFRQITQCLTTQRLFRPVMMSCVTVLIRSAKRAKQLTVIRKPQTPIEQF